MKNPLPRSVTDLTGTEKRILRALRQSPDSAVTRGALLLAGWRGARIRYRTGSGTLSRRVDMAISRLRRKVRGIRSHRGRGYSIC